jgi:lysophospholipid acyltransferase (LPLAT)-like uncharacterized protein
LALHLSQHMIRWRLVPVCYIFLRTYMPLLRLKIIGEKTAYDQLKEHGRIIVPVWHQRLFPALAYVRRFREFRPIVMISQSRDGEFIADIAQRLGLVPVRGSSSRGGTEALKTIVSKLEEHPAVGHVVDGPRGPKGKVKPGLIRIAQLSGAVILPLILSVDRAWIAGSWDRFLIPKPFSRVTARWEEPFSVPRKADLEELDVYRREIEDRLIRAHAEADLGSGWKTPL